MSWTRFLSIAAIALAAYGLSYALINKPLTDGEVEQLYKQKMVLLEHDGDRRLFILAGSNGRFSHSCAVITRETGRWCGNLSIAAGLGLDFLFQSYSPLLRTGDTVYMPLEYEQYQADKDTAWAGPDNVILFKRRRDLLEKLGFERSLHVAFYPDERYFIHGLAETVLKSAGVRRRFTDASVNEVGDQQAHTEEAGRPYRDFIRSQKKTIPDLSRDLRSYSVNVIRSFLRDARNRGIHVVGGLPTVYNDIEIPPATIDFLEKLYTSEGQQFLVLPNKSQYDRSCFFDIGYHLNEGCQVRHSLLLAHALVISK